MNGLKIYRYPFHGWWNVFPAPDTEHALREAAKCIYAPIHVELLEVWDGERYVPVPYVDKEHKRRVMAAFYGGEEVQS